MSKYSVIKSRTVLVVCFTALSAISGLASCGAGVNGNDNGNNVATTISVSASPGIIAYGAANTKSVITWSSLKGSSCSSSLPGVSGASGSVTTPSLDKTTTYTITCGSDSEKVTVVLAAAYIVDPINNASACTAYPQRATGTVYYYCDCGTGAQAGCVAGNDKDNDGLSPATPKRTIGSAAFTMRTLLAKDDTVALCRGGAFNATGSLNIGSSRCDAGTACNDLRDYTPPSGNTAKPIINNAAGAVDLFSFGGNIGGVRLLNLKLQGVPGVRGDRNNAFFFFAGAHDVTMCNLEMNAFDLAVSNAGGNAGVPTTTNIKLTGSTITNSRRIGFLGGGNNAELSYNYWDGNGSTNKFDHAIYIAADHAVSNMSIVGNYSYGQHGSSCQGAPIVGHASVDGFLVANNVVDIDAAAATGFCFGIGIGSGGGAYPVYLRNTKFVGNIIKNGGRVAFSVGNCPDCVIENNLIIQDWAYGPNGSYELTGINVPAGVAVIPKDDVGDRALIRNNTVWFGPRAIGGGVGIRVSDEGTGHVIVNNSVYYSSTSAGQGVDCFDYKLPLTSYAYINNNHCGSATATYSWVAGIGDFAAWRAVPAASLFDTVSVTGDPLYTNLDTNFAPKAGSPLLDAGTTSHTSPYSGIDITGKARPTAPATHPAIGAFEP